MEQKESTITAQQTAYLKKVHLQGYKTIRNTAIEFQPGLNIIIGQNGAGKTNFVEFLNHALTANNAILFNTKANIDFENNKGDNISIEIDNTPPPPPKENSPGNYTYFIKPKLHLSSSEKNVQIFKIPFRGKFLIIDNDIFVTKLIGYSVPENFPIVNYPFGFFQYPNQSFPSIDIEEVFSDNTPLFSKSLIAPFMIGSITKHRTTNEITQYIHDRFTQIKRLSPFLKEFTPITDIRLNPNINIHQTKLNAISITNLFLEFEVDEIWLPFFHLSDGTKRMFYIIAETIFMTNFSVHYGSPDAPLIGFNIKPKTNIKESPIIFIEEPELGIHPHQLAKIMAFLKEQSEDKQIIITTHSPQVLDILDKDELNRLIIAYMTDEGTKLRHLTTEQTAKAKLYMDDMYLSDYWLHSDLEV